MHIESSAKPQYSLLRLKTNLNIRYPKNINVKLARDDLIILTCYNIYMINEKTVDFPTYLTYLMRVKSFASWQ